MSILFLGFKCCQVLHLLGSAGTLDNVSESQILPTPNPPIPKTGEIGGFSKQGFSPGKMDFFFF